MRYYNKKININNIKYYFHIIILLVFSLTLLFYIIYLTLEIQSLSNQMLLLEKQTMCFQEQINELNSINMHLKKEISEIIKNKNLFEDLNSTNNNIDKRFNTFDDQHQLTKKIILLGLSVLLTINGFNLLAFLCRSSVIIENDDDSCD
jgi:hypothetical protein